MKRTFLANIAFLLLINLLIKPFYIFGIDRTVQNTVGPDEYGIFFTLLNLSYILTIINDLGIQNFNNRNISQNSQLISKHLSHILGIKILLAATYIVFCPTTSGTTARNFPSDVKAASCPLTFKSKMPFSSRT